MNNDLTVKKGEECPTCGSFYDRTVSVDGLIIRNKSVLMILRNAGQEIGKWALIGGHLNWDETAEEGMLREIKEEIGVDVSIIKLLGVYSDPKRDPKNSQTVAIAYLLHLLKEDFKLQKEEVKDVKWFEMSDLPEDIAFDHRKIIDNYINNSHEKNISYNL